MTTSNLICPACGDSMPRNPVDLVEKHRDRIAGKDYELIRCAYCRVVFTEPRDPVGADWYTKAFSLGIIERSPVDMAGIRVNQFRSHRLPLGRLFDIGCGDGGFLKAAQELGYTTSGFDFDPDAIEKARALGLDARVSNFDAVFGDSKLQGAFDVVTLFDVLEHVPEPAEFLARAKGLAKAGGHMVFTMPDDRRPHPWIREELDYPPNHYTRWKLDNFRSFLERLDFQVVMITSWPIDARYLAGQAFFGFLMPRCLPWIKRLLFAESGSGRSITEEFQRVQAKSETSAAGPLADKSFRNRLVNGTFTIFHVLLLPITLPIALGYRLAGCGHTLYALARVPLQ